MNRSRALPPPTGTLVQPVEPVWVQAHPGGPFVPLQGYGVLRPGRALSDIWWLHPVWCAFAMLLLYLCFPAFDYSRVVPRTYIPGPQYYWGICLLLALISGAAAMAALHQRRANATPPQVELHVPRWVMGLLLVLTLFAYAFWFAPLMANPGILIDAMTSGQGNVRRDISTTPGVTTMTQFGVAYAIGYAVRTGARVDRVRGWEHLGMLAVSLAAVIRSVAWGERLAVIELVVCWSVAAFAFMRIRHPSNWRLANLLPLLGPPLVLVAFTATEYFRSWNYYQNQYDSIWQFAFERLMAYYATASNNGVGLLVENTQWPQYSGRYLAEWLYHMPGGIGEAATAAFGDVSQQYVEFLRQFARIELNNTSGLFPIVFDVGYLGSAVYFVVVGALIGRVWMGWRRQQLAGLLFYPPFALFLIEILRINYIGSTRFFPIALALGLIYAASRMDARAPVAHPYVRHPYVRPHTRSPRP